MLIDGLIITITTPRRLLSVPVWPRPAAVYGRNSVGMLSIQIGFDVPKERDRNGQAIIDLMDLYWICSSV